MVLRSGITKIPGRTKKQTYSFKNQSVAFVVGMHELQWQAT